MLLKEGGHNFLLKSAKKSTFQSAKKRRSEKSAQKSTIKSAQKSKLLLKGWWKVLEIAQNKEKWPEKMQKKVQKKETWAEKVL